jgi:hypothetical protein
MVQPAMNQLMARTEELVTEGATAVTTRHQTNSQAAYGGSLNVSLFLHC